MRGPICLGFAVVALLLAVASTASAVAVQWRIAGDGSNALYPGFQCEKASVGCAPTGPPRVLRGELRADAEGTRFTRIRGTLTLGKGARLVVTGGDIDLAGDGTGVLGTLMTASHGEFSFRENGFRSDLPTPAGGDPNQLLHLLGLGQLTGGGRLALVLQARVVLEAARLRRVSEAPAAVSLLLAALLLAAERQRRPAV